MGDTANKRTMNSCISIIVFLASVWCADGVHLRAAEEVHNKVAEARATKKAASAYADGSKRPDNSYLCNRNGVKGTACLLDCGCKVRCVLAKCQEGGKDEICHHDSHCDSKSCIRGKCADGTLRSTCNKNSDCNKGDCEGNKCFCPFIKSG